MSEKYLKVINQLKAELSKLKTEVRDQVKEKTEEIERDSMKKVNSLINGFTLEVKSKPLIESLQL